MLNPDVLRAKDHSNYVEAIGVAWHLVAGDPDFCGPDELSFLAPAYLRQWAAEIEGFAGFYLYECHRPLPPFASSASRHQVDVAVPIAEPVLRYLPAVSMQPPCCDALAAKTHRLPRR